jgi:hypothetical protein
VGDLGLAENIPFRSGERERIENVGADANAARGIGPAVVREPHNPSLPRALSWDCDTWSMRSESRVLLVSVAERAETLAVPHPFERIPRPYERIRTLGAV